MNVSDESADTRVCRMCNRHGCDVKLLGCGCTLHARCVPLPMILNWTPGEVLHGRMPSAVSSKPTFCSVCKAGEVNGIFVFPMSLSALNEASELKRNAQNMTSANGTKNGKGKRSRDSTSDDLDAASPYLLMSQRTHHSDSHSANSVLHRTGRWTKEEIAYVDFLLSAFSCGILPLPHGIKLNEFLGEILMCRSSRLTKKLTNAKLSMRSYELLRNPTALDCAKLTQLQDDFVASVESEPLRLELMFNSTKLWRTQFSNMCVQVGYSRLESSVFLKGLSEMEHQAAATQQELRNVRQRAIESKPRADSMDFVAKMVLAGEFSNFVQQPLGNVHLSNSSLESPAFSAAPDPTIGNSIDVFDLEGYGSDIMARDRILSVDLDSHLGPPPSNQRSRALSSDFSVDLDDLLDQNIPTFEKMLGKHENSTFLDALADFLESKDLPFEYVDFWIMSNNQNDSSKTNADARLFYGGHATRKDIDPMIAMQLHEFGEYSAKFSYAPGVGLPGRIFSVGKPLWETEIDNTDISVFTRAAGAKIYGVKTVLGIPLVASIGNFVIAFYSTRNLEEDRSVIDKCIAGVSGKHPDVKCYLKDDGVEKPLNPGDLASKLVVNKAQQQGIRSEFQPPGPLRAKRVPPLQKDMSFVDYSMDKWNLDHHNHQNHQVPLGSMKPPSVLGGVPIPAPPKPSPKPTPPQTSNLSNISSDDQAIASLLGQHMPASEHFSGPTQSNMLTTCMQLRLLLLRPGNKRTSQENKLLAVLRNSFRSFSANNNMTGSRLVMLLAKDWQMLIQQPQQQQQKFHQGQQLGSPLRTDSLGVTRRASLPSMPGGAQVSLPGGATPMRAPLRLATVAPPLKLPASFPEHLPGGSQVATMQRRLSTGSLESSRAYQNKRKVSITSFPEARPSKSHLPIHVVEH